MSLVMTGYQSVDDSAYYSTMFGAAASYGFSSYAPTNTGFNTQFGAVVPSNQSGYMPRVLNPFHKRETPYLGRVGEPNSARPGLRPENDRLDKLVQVALVKMDATIHHLGSLADEADGVRRTMADSQTGGSSDLREQLTAANKEIFRLRTLLAQEGGAGDLGYIAFGEDEDEGEEDDEEEEEETILQAQQSQQDYLAAAAANATTEQYAAPPSSASSSQQQSQGNKQFSFFGLMVADGIRLKNEHNTKHEYGAVKVVKVWGPSAAAGIKQMDFITHINSSQVFTLSDFNRVVGQIQPNQLVHVQVERNGKQMQFQVQTSNTDIEPGTITHHNQVHAHIENQPSPTSQNRIQNTPTGRISGGPSRRREESIDTQTLHL